MLAKKYLIWKFYKTDWNNLLAFLTISHFDPLKHPTVSENSSLDFKPGCWAGRLTRERGVALRGAWNVDGRTRVGRHCAERRTPSLSSWRGGWRDGSSGPSSCAPPTCRRTGCGWYFVCERKHRVVSVSGNIVGFNGVEGWGPGEEKEQRTELTEYKVKKFKLEEERKRCCWKFITR